MFLMKLLMLFTYLGVSFLLWVFSRDVTGFRFYPSEVQMAVMATVLPAPSPSSRRGTQWILAFTTHM